MPLGALLVAFVAVLRVSGLHADPRGAAPVPIQQHAPAKDHPMAGEWTADIAKSKLSPSLPLRRVTLNVTVGADTVTMASRFVTGSGPEQRAAETFRTDGAETPGTLSPGVVLVARWLDPHVLATLARKDGRVLGLVTYEVSADRMTLTLRSSGLVEHVVVFDRQ